MQTSTWYPVAWQEDDSQGKVKRDEGTARAISQFIGAQQAAGGQQVEQAGSR